MNATLSFTLPEEREEFETAVKALDWKFAMSDLDEYLRMELNHAPHDLNPDTLEHIRSKLFDILNERGLNLHD
jgi:hypothetical protein